MRDLGIKAIILSVLLAMTGIAICAPFFDHADAQESVVVIVPPDGLSQENPMDLILGFEAIAAEVHRRDSVNVLILMTDAPYENGDVYLAITMAIGEGRFVTADVDRPLHRPGFPHSGAGPSRLRPRVPQTGGPHTEEHLRPEGVHVEA